MGFIKEPKGVDFIINSTPLTENEKTAFTKFIAERKELNKRKIKTAKRKKTKVA